MADAVVADVAIDFIAFCYQRDRREWPRLYDEMCYVASKRLYRGLGYAELKDAGVDMTFSGMARLSRIAKEVVREMGATPPVSKRELVASY
ncbi:MAG: hypothetical protein KGN00_11075 [Chloroflexota bacterium]|nr:hypothetical protein [Chloroflexota bacterium]